MFLLLSPEPGVGRSPEWATDARAQVKAAAAFAGEVLRESCMMPRTFGDFGVWRGLPALRC